MKVFRFLFILVGISIIPANAHDLFRPLPTSNCHNLSLVKWTPIPFRIQYHGFVESSKLNRYIFMVDGEMVYLQPNETAPQQFVLKQVLQNGYQVLIEDKLTHQLHLLNSGEISYISGKFECILLDKSTGQQFIFSDAKNREKTNNREIFVTQKNSNLYAWEITKNSKPILSIFPIIPSK